MTGQPTWAKVPDALLCDPAISAHAVRVYGILRRRGTTPDRCHPSYEFIAQRMGASERSVPAWVRELEVAGWIVRHERTTSAGRRGQGYTVHDTPVLPQGTAGQPARTRVAQRGGDRASQRGGERAAQRGASALCSADASALHSAVKESKGNESKGTRTPVAPAGQLALVPGQAAPAARAAANGAGHDVMFDRFWQVYPRRVGKLDARKAWARALRQAPDHVIIAGAQRYADDPNRSDEYTAHPATWLRAGRWADDPLPQRGAARGNGQTRGQAAIDGYLRQRGGDPRRGVLHHGSPDPKGLPR